MSVILYLYASNAYIQYKFCSMLNCGLCASCRSTQSPLRSTRQASGCHSSLAMCSSSLYALTPSYVPHSTTRVRLWAEEFFDNMMLNYMCCWCNGILKARRATFDMLPVNVLQMESSSFASSCLTCMECTSSRWTTWEWATLTCSAAIRYVWENILNFGGRFCCFLHWTEWQTWIYQ